MNDGGRAGSANAGAGGVSDGGRAGSAHAGAGGVSDGGRAGSANAGSGGASTNDCEALAREYRERLAAAQQCSPQLTVEQCLDLPLGHANAAYVRSHFDAMEVGIQDGPRPDELLLCIAMACGPRIHDRMGGLAAADISVWDGQR